eukprot:jgi/Tetstr1/434594/TSEL_023685.t1
MEAVDDGDMFRLAYLRKHMDKQMHNGGTFGPLDVPEHKFATARKLCHDEVPATVADSSTAVEVGEAIPTYFITDAEAKAYWSEVMRGSIEALLYGTGDWRAKVLDLLTTSLTAGTYDEFFISEENNPPMGCAGEVDSPATGPTIIDMEHALQIRQLNTIAELRRAPLPCDVITAILDLAALPTSTTYYGNILRDGTAVCLAFMFYSHGESSVSCRLHDMAIDDHNITPFVNHEKAGHRKRRDGFKPLLQIPAATAVPARTTLMRRFVVYRDAAFGASPSANQPDRLCALPGDGATPPLT